MKRSDTKGVQAVPKGLRVCPSFTTAEQDREDQRPKSLSFYIDVFYKILKKEYLPVIVAI